VSGGTDSHVFLMDVFAKGVRGKEAEKALDAAWITANRNTIPFDVNPPLNPSGIRLGSPAVTTRGFKEADMREVGSIISSVIAGKDDEAALAAARSRVKALTAKYPLYSWKLAGSAVA
jgi:glycine hydroxymethyltransferase